MRTPAQLVAQRYWKEVVGPATNPTLVVYYHFYDLNSYIAFGVREGIAIPIKKAAVIPTDYIEPSTQEEFELAIKIVEQTAQKWHGLAKRGNERDE